MNSTSKHLVRLSNLLLMVVFGLIAALVIASIRLERARNLFRAYLRINPNG